MIYMIFADGFEEIEAIETLDILRRAELDVLTVGLDGEMVTGAHNVTVKTDIPLDDIEPEKLDMLILPGGPGYVNLDKSKDVENLVMFCTEEGKYIAAICAAPSIIGKRGITKGKTVTCFPGYEDEMNGADVLCEKVVCDANIITARGAGAAADFGFKIVEVLKDKAAADALRKSMQYVL